MTISLAPFIDSWPFLLKAIGVTLFISVFSMLSRKVGSAAIAR